MANTRKADGQPAEPAGCLYGPGGPMTADQLTPGDRAAMAEFRAYLRQRREAAEAEAVAPVHLVIGPREYIGFRAQGWIACDPAGKLSIPMRQRTRDAGKATCSACLSAVAEAGEAEPRTPDEFVAMLGEVEARAEARAVPLPAEPMAALDQLGAKWSPDIDAYAAGQLDAAEVRCVLCGRAPCACPPFGSAEYLAMVNRLHGRTR